MAKKKTPKKVVKKLQKKVSQKMVIKEDAKIRPLGSRVLIRPFTKQELQEKSGEKNSFGLILPSSNSKEKSEQGIVLAVGPGNIVDGKLLFVSVKVGDTVAFSKYGYDDIVVDGEELYLIKEENILAVLKK